MIAQNAGITTLTATYQGSMAQATVTVYSGPDLPLGTTVWSPETSPGYSQLSMMPGVPTNNNSPTFFFIETDSSQQTIVHGISQDGSAVWATPGGLCSFCQLALTDDGGIIVSSGDGGGITTKIDGTGNQVWSYQTNTFFSAGAVGENGTIYGLEGSGPYYLLAVDGSTGIPKARSPIPTFDPVNGIGQVSIMPNGTAYAVAYVGQQVWLIGLTSGGVPSQQVIGQSPLVVTSTIIPDGNGGVLVAWGNPVSTFVSDIGGSANGTYSTLGADGGLQAVLGDTGAAYILGSSLNTHNSNAILAVSTSTGAALWQWDFPAGHSGSLVASQAGGGVVAVDVTYDGSGDILAQNVVRLDGNGSPTYDTWSAGPGSLAYYGNGVWLNGHDHTSNTQPVGPVSATTAAVADTDWINPAGNERKQARPPKRVKFQEGTACSAVDDTNVDSTWIMVPMSGSNNGAKVKIRGNTQDVQFVSEDTTIATVTPAAPTGGNTPITVSGLKSGQITTIDARSISDPSHNYAQMKVVVKPRITKTVDIFRIIDPTNNLTPQTVPDFSALQTYLNNVWGTQSNTYFTVNSRVDKTVHYDLLPSPNGDGTLNDMTVFGSDLSEEAAIFNLTHPSGSTSQLQADYINKIGPPIGGTWPAGRQVEGLSLNAGSFSFVEDTPAGPGPYNLRTNISAHELGHAVGTYDIYEPRSKVNNQIMYGDLKAGDPQNPCEVRRCDWSRMNPTAGDNGTLGNGCEADRIGLTH